MSRKSKLILATAVFGAALFGASCGGGGGGGTASAPPPAEAVAVAEEAEEKLHLPLNKVRSWRCWMLALLPQEPLSQ